MRRVDLQEGFDFNKWKARQPQQRMAGSALENTADSIIAELRGERDDGIIQNAMDDLYSLREINKDINSRWDSARQIAGVTAEQTGDVQLVGSITPTVPQAVVVNSGSQMYKGAPTPNEVRMHAVYQGNPVTGQLDVVPYVPKGSNDALVTRFGVGQQEGMDSDEYLGKRILQLLGRQPVVNNNRRHTAVDLIDELSGKKVDVELGKVNDIKQDGIGLQAYTQIVPRSQAGVQVHDTAESYDVARQMARELKPLIKQKMVSENLSMTEAVDALTREGKVSNFAGDRAPYVGKLFKEEGKYADNVVYPVYSNFNAKRNLARAGQRELVAPLEGAYLANVSAAVDLLNSQSGRAAADAMSVRPLPGNDRRTPSGKLYLQVPTSNTAVLTDLGERAPLVRQLFKEQ